MGSLSIGVLKLFMNEKKFSAIYGRWVSDILFARTLKQADKIIYFLVLGWLIL